jgi:RNA polymerase sigma-70 factor (ECF subfamily)
VTGARADAAESFEPHRPRLIRVAYRMLGSVADAEDVVQDAFLRWLDTNRTAVETPEAYLTRTVTRLCLDVLKSARRRHETYVGPWLPEPVVEIAEDPDDVTLPLLVALQRLSPLERAAFLLHDVFGMEFDEVAMAIGRDAAACRQLASRARVHVRAGRPRFAVSPERGLELASAFFAASQSGNMHDLKAMLAAVVTLIADGGGKRSAALAPVVGLAAVLDVHEQLAARIFARTPSRLVRLGFINGLPGYVTAEADGALQTTAFEITDGRVATIYLMRNPDKLGHLDGLSLH